MTYVHVEVDLNIKNVVVSNEINENFIKCNNR